MSIKMLAVDLDGTLVADSHTIPARTRAAIKAAITQDVHVAIATGREYPVTQKFIRMLGLITPVVCYQGALIYDHQTDTIIASAGIPLLLTYRLIDLARSQNLALHLYLGHQAFVEAPTALSRKQLSHTGISPKEVNDLTQVITSPPIKGLIVHPAEEAGEAAAQLAAALGDTLNVFRSYDTLIEVTSPEVSKGTAVAKLADYYHVSRNDVMAIGDQDNDIEMIAWAGTGVAMGNASPGAKAAADYIAPPISEEGAAWAIEHFILDSRSTRPR